MATTIQRWGNSLGIRIPKTFVDALRLREGTPVAIRLEEDELIISAADAEFSLAGLVASISDSNQHSEEFDDASAGREII